MKRFYKEAAASRTDGGFCILLDGRQLKSPEKRGFCLPSQGLADAVAAEWAAQDEEIQPDSMPMMSIAATALDRTALNRDVVLEDLQRYAGSDLIAYRAAEPDELAVRQAKAWDVWTDRAAGDFPPGIVTTTGIMPVAQDEAYTNALMREVRALDDFRLTVFTLIVQTSGSALLSLMLMRGELTADELHALSVVDEHYSQDKWGEDWEATDRLTAKALEITQAAQFLALLDS